MEQALEAAWNRYQAALSQAGDPGQNLIDFANQHAVDDKLRHDAVLLQMALNAADGPEARAAAFDRMAELVDKIAHSRSTATRADIDEFDRRLSTFEHHRGKDVERDVVCRGTGLGFAFPGGRFRLTGVDLCLRAGEITGVIGENGNGKTTLFRIVVGRLRHAEGRLEYPSLDPRAGEAIDWPAVKRDIAYVPQELPPLYGTMEEILRYTASLHDQVGDENDLALDHIATRLRLTEYLDRRWNQLSGGFKLRFALARALISRPRLLVLDEPLANLDFLSQLTVLRDVSDLARSFRNPIAVLISSQHLHEIEAVADSILFLKRGQVTFNGPIEDVGENARENVFELGTDLAVDDLQERLSIPEVHAITHNGLSYVIRTDRSVTPAAFLARLLEHGVPVEYFRDLTRSVKQLFETELPKVGETV